MEPESFDEDLASDWGLWVLDHGLPLIPPTVEVGQSVPVARWAGTRFGAVLHVQWMWTDDHDDHYLASLVEVFVRVADRWVASDSDGGSDWFQPPFARPEWIGRRQASMGNELVAGGDDWSCRAIDGIAGSDARFVEMEDSTGTLRQGIESLFGAFIACSDGEAQFTIRVLDGEAVVLAEGRYGA